MRTSRETVRLHEGTIAGGGGSGGSGGRKVVGEKDKEKEKE